MISDNGVSRVWREDDWVYKRQPKFLADNEIWCLETLLPSGYVPQAQQVDIETIRLRYIEPEPVTRPDTLLWHGPHVLRALAEAGIRHGDLTDKNIIVAGNRPYLIDFAESRLTCDPRPDKRREGDTYWLMKTLQEYARGS